MNNTLTRYFPYFIITGFTFLVLRFLFREAFWHPNDYTFMTGGDGNVIYFNMIYHVLHGGGLYLENMNHPEPECIILTDAQAMFSIALSAWGKIFPWIQSHVIGIVHSLFMVAIWLQFILLYKINRTSGASQPVSILFSFAIGMLSPQLVRISFGHFGLAYPFIIPMTILWLLNYKKHEPFNWRTIAFVFASLLFGFNNPYLLVIISLLLIAYGFVGGLLNKWRSSFFAPIGLGIVFLLLLLIITRVLDPYDDRIHQQWGALHFASTFEGLAWGRYSLLNRILQFLNISYVGESEARATLSLTSIIILIVATFLSLFKIRTIKKSVWSHPIVVLAFAALLIFLFTSAFFKSKWWMWVIEHADFVTMVKATGRLSWIPYYVGSLVAVYFLIHWGRERNNKLTWKIFILLIGLFWTGEGILYIKDYARPKLFSNHFSQNSIASYIEKKSEVLDFSKYQGIVTIPPIQSWNDNIINSGDWATELQAFTLSLGSGLPLLGAKLSRAPVERSLENLQWVANPLIAKSLLQRLPVDQPILLLKTCNINIGSIGETWLLDNATIIYQDESVDIFELWPSDLDNKSYVQGMGDKCSLDSNWYYYNGFENGEAKGKIGNGLLTRVDWKIIETIEVPDSTSGDYELSVWCFVNIEKHGMPAFEVWIFNADGSQVFYNYLDSRNSYDAQNGWLRSSINLQLKPKQKVFLKARGRYPMQIDELLLRPLESGPTCIYNEDKIVAINNYVVGD